MAWRPLVDVRLHRLEEEESNAQARPHLRRSLAGHGLRDDHPNAADHLRHPAARRGIVTGLESRAVLVAFSKRHSGGDGFARTDRHATHHSRASNPDADGHESAGDSNPRLGGCLSR